MLRRLGLALTLTLLLVAAAGGTGHPRSLLQQSQGATNVTVVNSTQFWAALANNAIQVVQLESSLVLDTAPASTVFIGRNVTVGPAPALLSAGTKVFVDWRDQAMVISIAPGATLQLAGLEMVGMYGLLGPTANFVRQSVGARLEMVDCVTRRRAGLPLAAAYVNMLSLPRAAGVPGKQQVVLVPSYTYNTTRSPQPVRRDSDVAIVLDVRTTVPPDSSLAFQGLYLGGYTMFILNTAYYADRVVAQSCLDSRTGDECVAALLRQLDAEEAAQQGQGGVGQIPAAAAAAAAAAPLGSEAVIAIAVVVPVVVLLLLLAAVGAAVVIRRRRTHRGLSSGLPTTARPAGAGPSIVAGPGSRHMGGVFLGTDPDDPEQQLVWTEKHDAQALAEFSACRHAADTFACVSSAGVMLASSMTPMHHEQQHQHQQPQHQPQPQLQPGEGSPHPFITGGLKTAFSAVASCRPTQQHTAAAHPAAAGPAASAASGAAASASSAAAGAATSSSGGAAGLDAVIACDAQQLKPLRHGADAASVQAFQNKEQQPAAAASDDEVPPQPPQLLQQAMVSGAAAAGAADEPAVRLPESPGQLHDVAAELAAMAMEMRVQVNDAPIRIDGVLGTGAFGVVYAGVWQGLPVAVKTVVISASRQQRKRALQEAALCQSVVHANIIATYACELQPIGAAVTASTRRSDEGGGAASRRGVASLMPRIVDWRMYLIQELADGGPLSRLYGNVGIWPAPSAPHMLPVVALALGIARALEHLHSKRIVHRDLSPNNVMLKRDASEPSGFAAKVGDFGLSVIMPEHRTHLSNLRMGTMFYMCPDVVMKGQVGTASDVFAFGVILWELFHGRQAGVMTHEGPRYAAIFPAFPPHCPLPYTSLALNCLQRRATARPSAAVVVEHLEQLLACVRAAAELC